MNEEFLRITQRDFCFSENDLNDMRKTFKTCELIEKDGCFAAIQKFDDVTYLYFFAVSQRNAGNGKRFIIELIDVYNPNVFSAVTCHPAMIKIIESVIKEKGYKRSADSDVVNKIIRRLEQDEGKIEYFLKSGKIVLRKFYGHDIPQKDRDFIIPEYLEAGDAILLIVKK